MKQGGLMKNNKNRADLSKIKRISVDARTTKADIGKFASVPESIKPFFDSLPDFLKASDLKNLAFDMNNAHDNDKAIVWMMGAHPIKLGLSPIIIDLIKNKYITHLALNGACIIHDFEIAYWGRTSEEVADTLADGSFGMVEETPKMLAEAIAQADKDTGIGEAVGMFIRKMAPRYEQYSLIAAAHKYELPVSVHIAIGTDTIGQHPEYDAALWAKKSHLDFTMLSANVKDLNQGGVVINFGSAVILPEVFLKALTVGRNLYGKITDFSAANFDMIQHYRPNTNVVNRPTLGGGRRYSFTGHHEIMMPLLAAALKSIAR
jgi:hypothetical protein